MSDTPRYTSIRDYLRVIREQRLLVVLIVVVFAGAAVLVSVREKPSYLAEASLAYQDTTQDLSLTGTVGIPSATPEARAAVAATQVTQPRVAELVKAALHSPSTVKALQGAVSVNPEARTNLVIIQARSGNAGFAARLANEFARQARIVATEADRQRFAQAARAAQDSVDKLGKKKITAVGSVPTVIQLARLQQLAKIARPVNVTSLATVPSRPVSPRPIRNLVLGILLGLTVALLVAFLRDSLDRRFKGSRELRDDLELPLLAFVREELLGRSPSTHHDGRRLEGPDLEAFRILRSNVEFLDVDRQPGCIAVTSALPEEGKSTVSAALAWACAVGGKSTLLVECDLRRPTLAARLGIEAAPGLTDHIKGDAGPAEILQPVALHTGSSNGAGPETGPKLMCITAGSPTPRPAELLGSERFRAMLAEVSEAYDVVILDTSPLLSVVDTQELLPHVDAILLCVRATRTTREQARAAREAMRHLPHKPTGLVVTGLRSGEDPSYGYYSYSYAYGAKA